MGFNSGFKGLNDLRVILTDIWYCQTNDKQSAKAGAVIVTPVQSKLTWHVLPVSPVYLWSDFQFQLPHLVLS